LTGKSAVDIEEEMGFPSTRAGGGVPVEVLRRLAHYLILEASGHLAPPKEATPPKSSARKRGVSEVERSQEAKVSVYFRLVTFNKFHSCMWPSINYVIQ
jgi:hypothetical protein